VPSKLSLINKNIHLKNRIFFLINGPVRGYKLINKKMVKYKPDESLERKRLRQQNRRNYEKLYEYHKTRREKTGSQMPSDSESKYFKKWQSNRIPWWDRTKKKLYAAKDYAVKRTKNFFQNAYDNPIDTAIVGYNVYKAFKQNTRNNRDIPFRQDTGRQVSTAIAVDRLNKLWKEPKISQKQKNLKQAEKLPDGLFKEKVFKLQGFFKHKLPFSERITDPQINQHTFTSVIFTGPFVTGQGAIINHLANGTGVGQYVGTEIVLKKLDFQFFYSMQAPATQETVRYLITYDLQPNQTSSLQVDDLLETIDVYSMTNWYNRDRFIILYDKTFTVNTNTPNVVFNNEFQLNNLITRYSPNYSFNMSIGQLDVTIIGATDSITALSKAILTWRLYYIDP